MFQLYKQTNKRQFLYVFILQFLYNSTRFERPFRSSSGVHDLLYSAALHKPCKRVCRRNGRSKRVELYKNCRIYTYRKCILLVCLYNWLRCTVRTMSNFLCFGILKLFLKHIWTKWKPDFIGNVHCFRRIRDENRCELPLINVYHRTLKRKIKRSIFFGIHVQEAFLASVNDCICLKCGHECHYALPKCAVVGTATKERENIFTWRVKVKTVSWENLSASRLLGTELAQFYLSRAASAQRTDPVTVDRIGSWRRQRCRGVRL